MALYALRVGCPSALAPSHAPGQPLLQRDRSLPPCVGALSLSPAGGRFTCTSQRHIHSAVHETMQQPRAIWCRPAAHTAWPGCSSPYAIQGIEPTIAAAWYRCVHSARSGTSIGVERGGHHDCLRYHRKEQELRKKTCMLVRDGMHSKRRSVSGEPRGRPSLGEARARVKGVSKRGVTCHSLGIGINGKEFGSKLVLNRASQMRLEFTGIASPISRKTGVYGEENAAQSSVQNFRDSRRPQNGVRRNIRVIAIEGSSSKGAAHDTRLCADQGAENAGRQHNMRRPACTSSIFVERATYSDAGSDPHRTGMASARAAAEGGGRRAVGSGQRETAGSDDDVRAAASGCRQHTANRRSHGAGVKLRKKMLWRRQEGQSEVVQLLICGTTPERARKLLKGTSKWWARAAAAACRGAAAGAASRRGAGGQKQPRGSESNINKAPAKCITTRRRALAASAREPSGKRLNTPKEIDWAGVHSHALRSGVGPAFESRPRTAPPGKWP
ncbi:hypothetical protein B0H14DRAFT_2556104 [Mycena olivaceomarginata]|nr:hypothetical protein B0H14DRAFT_2556104 [Mycena olivaceomarginata]